MSHISQVQAAIDLIEDNLKQELLTEAIARRAGFSSWHFQRIFRAMVGDSVKEYVRKRRLTQAAEELSKTDNQIIDIAFDYQFESQESFSRAFKAVFGITPGQCRKHKRALMPQKKPRITEAVLEHLYGGITMKPKIVAIGEMKVVGMEANFVSVLSSERNNHEVIPQLWSRFMSRYAEIQNKVRNFDLGLCDEIAPGNYVPKDGEMFYLACTEVTCFQNVPQGMRAKVIPAGKYAVFTHKGTLERIEYTMNYIYGSWLPRSGYERANGPDIELYDCRFKIGLEDSEFDIYLPLL